MARQEGRRRAVLENEFGSSDGVCHEVLERQFQTVCALEVQSNEESEDIITVRRLRQTNRILDTSESSTNDNETDQNSNWQNVCENEEYSGSIEFSTGEKVQGPQGLSNCTTPMQFFSLFFTDELVAKIVGETNLYAQEIINSQELSVDSIWHIRAIIPW